MDGEIPDPSCAELSHDNGAPSNGFKQEPVKDDVDRKSEPRETSPVPGTSKSSGARRRTSKEPKRNSPDPAEGSTSIMRVLTCVFIKCFGRNIVSFIRE